MIWSDQGVVMVAKKQTDAERRREKYASLINAPELKQLTELQKAFLEKRWLDQLNWFSDEAKRYQNWFYWMRLITIVCSVLAPVFVSFGSVWGDRLSDRVLANAIALNLINDNPPSPAPSPPPEGVTSPEVVSPEAASPQPNRPNELATLADAALPSPTERALASTAFHVGLFLSQIVAILAAVEQFFKFGDRWRRYRRTSELLKSLGWQFLQLSGSYAVYAKTGGHREAFPLFANQVEELIQSDVEEFTSQIAVQKQIDQSDSSHPKDA